MIKAEAVLPGRKFNPRAWEKHFKNEARAWTDEVNQDYTKSHRTWSAESTPEHKTAVKVRRGRVEATVQMIGAIYGYVHEGTRPHKIKAKGRGLKFQTGYTAKTSVGYLASFPGGPFGPMTGAKEVDHPGFPGRKQSEAIKANREAGWAEHMQKAIDAGAKDCGHAL